MMKVLLKLFFLTICLSEISFGQIQKPITKGCFLSGGSLSFSSDKTKDFQSVNVYGQPSVLSIRTQSFQTNLSLGYFAFNHLAFGIKTSIILSIETYTVDIVPSYILKLNNSTLIVGPFIRYSSNLGLFVESSAGIGLIKYEDNS